LADKIKCGNSLINDRSIVDNAFVWEEEFSEVFKQGGFDIIIGNPPYGAKLEVEQQEFLKNEFNLNSSDTAIVFIKLSSLTWDVNTVD
jgi:methylase of polypeptide subunit release factors